MLAFVVVAGCGQRDEPPAKRAPIVHEEEIPPPVQPAPPVQPDVAVDDVPAPAAIIDQAAKGGQDPKPECVDEATVVAFDPGKLRACFDSNGDGQADRCVTWRRDGKVQTIDTVFAVEDADAREEPEPPVEYRSDVDHNDDERITLDGTTVEICPFERTCIKIMPKVGDGEIQTVLTDPDYKRAALLIRDGEGKGTLELWDLAGGRMKARTAMKRLVADEPYDFSAHLGTGVVIAIADDSNGRALGTIFSLDGGFRGELAQGSRNLDIEQTFRHAGVFGIVDIGAPGPDKPYVLYLHSLASGGALGKFTIKRDGELSFHPLPNGFVAVTQWGEQLRIDMIDLRTRTNRVLFAPSC